MNKTPLKTSQFPDLCRLFGIAPVLAALLWLPLLSQAQAPNTRAAPVKVATVRQDTVSPVRATPGEVQARYALAVKAESSGTVAQLRELGDQVHAGETVAELVDPVYALRLRELQQDVDSASARVRFLQAEAERLGSLQKKNLASPREVEQNRSDLAQAQSQQKAAAARLRQLQQTVKRLQLRAPFDAYVVERVAQPGEYVRAGDPVLRLISRELRITASIPVAARPYVKKGQRWKVLFTDGSDPVQRKAGYAEVTAVVPSASTPSRHLRVLLDWPREGTSPGVDGQPVTVFYPQARPRRALLVPRDALVLRQNATYVFRVREGRAERLAVEPESGQQDWIAVSQLTGSQVIGDAPPLQAGDKVVVRGNERLRDGQAVQVIGSMAPSMEESTKESDRE